MFCFCFLVTLKFRILPTPLVCACEVYGYSRKMADGSTAESVRQGQGATVQKKQKTKKKLRRGLVLDEVVSRSSFAGDLRDLRFSRLAGGLNEHGLAQILTGRHRHLLDLIQLLHGQDTQRKERLRSTKFWLQTQNGKPNLCSKVSLC